MTTNWPCPIYRLQGPPGTGKTYTLTKAWIPRAVNLYGENAVHVCSLTRAAAAEIGGRANLPRERVSTLHSLAMRALGRPGLAEDETNIRDWNDTVQPEWRVSGKKRGNSDELEFSTARPEDGDSLLAEVTVLRNKMIPTEEWEGPVSAFYFEWRRWKRRQQLADFTDLLYLPIEMNVPPPDDIKVLICDEAQDFTFLAIALVQHWAKDLEMVVMAGDANQALYGFIGANPHAFMPEDIDMSEVTTLGQSYRVPKAPLEYANKWIAQDSDHRIFPYKPREEKGVVVDGAVVHKPEFTIDEPRWLVDNVVEMTADGSTAMILATCKFHLHTVLARLKSLGVPFHNPYRVKEGAWNPMRGGVVRLIAFLRPWRCELVGIEDTWTWAELFKWSDAIRMKGTFRHGAGREIKAAKKKQGGPSWEDVERLMVAEAYESMVAALRDDDPELALAWLEERLLPPGVALMEMALNVARTQGVSALEEEPRIIAGTYHSVKGGSAAYVYLAPDLGSAAMKEWNNIADDEGRNAIVRAFYVGITRASKAVALMGQSTKNAVTWI